MRIYICYGGAGSGYSHFPLAFFLFLAGLAKAAACDDMAGDKEMAEDKFVLPSHSQ